MVFEAKIDEVDGLKANNDRQKRTTDKEMPTIIQKR
jgi:hypothetical protein